MQRFQKLRLHQLFVPECGVLSFPALCEEFPQIGQALFGVQFALIKQIGGDAHTAKHALAGPLTDSTAQGNGPEIRLSILVADGVDNGIHHIFGHHLTFTQQNIFGLMMLIFGLKGGLASILPNIFPVVFVLGFMGYFNFHLNLATVTIAAIAIGLVVDDTIHYFTHFKHEFQETRKRKTAMLNALHKVGPALCFTSLILVLGYIIFLFSETRMLMDFGILSSIAVISALVGDLFIGPTLLVKFNIFRK